MKFKPCIDIHNGKVKQIVGGSLADLGDLAIENFVAEYDAVFYAKLYQKHRLKGGHIILLNPASSEFYQETKRLATEALKAYPKGLQIGGGIHAGNAKEFIDAGASHVILTSYVFKEGIINYENLEKIVASVGKKNIVLDLSCRKKDGDYYIVTDRWQKDTKEKVTIELLENLWSYCDEFLVHAVDVEGKSNGIEKELITILGEWDKSTITYAGGVHNFSDLEELKALGKNHLDVTIGSALDLFGGKMKFKEVIDYCID